MAEMAACNELVERLASIGDDFSIAEDKGRRLRTARATSVLLQTLNALRGKARVERLAANRTRHIPRSDGDEPSQDGDGA